MYSPPPVDFYVPIHSCLLPTDLLYANVLSIFSREIEQTGVIYQSSMYKREIFFLRNWLTQLWRLASPKSCMLLERWRPRRNVLFQKLINRRYEDQFLDSLLVSYTDLYIYIFASASVSWSYLFRVSLSSAGYASPLTLFFFCKIALCSVFLKLTLESFCQFLYKILILLVCVNSKDQFGWTTVNF